MCQRLPSGLLCATVLWLSACTFEGTLDPDVARIITCDSDSQCLDSQACLQGACVPANVRAPEVTSGDVATREDTDVAMRLTASHAGLSTPAFEVGRADHGAVVCGAHVLCPARDADAFPGCSADAHASGCDTITYRPVPDLHGDDALTVQASAQVRGGGPTLVSTRHTVAISVEPVNDLPTLSAASVAQLVDCGFGAQANLCLDEDSAVTVQLQQHDADGDALLINSASPSVLIGDGEFTYTPPQDFNGEDAVELSVVEDRADGAAATPLVLSVIVRPVPDAIVTDDLGFATDEEQPLVVRLEATDPDQTALHFEIIQQPDGARALTTDTGTFYGDEGFVLFDPLEDVFGVDTFRYVAVSADGRRSDDGDGVPATATVEVRPVSDPPRVLVQDARILVDANQPDTIDLSDLIVDPDGDRMQVQVPADLADVLLVQDQDVGPIDLVQVLPLTTLELQVAFTVFGCGDAGGPCGAVQLRVTLVTRSLPSCLAILDAHPEKAGQDGLYVVDPDQSDGEGSYLATCDMTHAGGGWTLALKIDGEASTFNGNSQLWESGELRNPERAGLDLEEAKLASFSQVPDATGIGRGERLQELLLAVFPRVDRLAVHSDGSPALPLSPELIRYARLEQLPPVNTLRELFQGGTAGMTLSRRGFTSLFIAATTRGLPAPQVQDCSLDGINRRVTVGTATALVHRLGVGFSAGSCNAGGATQLVSIGGVATPVAGIRATTGILPAFVWLFVRERSAAATASCGNGVVERTGDLAENEDTLGATDCSAGAQQFFCGNDTLEPALGELCDGADPSGDAADCRLDCIPSACGDGIAAAQQECDDGNRADGDGCSASCAVEFCGDASCNNFEDACRCPKDCGGCPNTCGPALGDGCCDDPETVESAPGDCVCNDDSVCDGGETACACPADNCPSPPDDNCCGAGESFCTGFPECARDRDGCCDPGDPQGSGDCL